MAIVKNFDSPFDQANLLDEGWFIDLSNDYPANGSVTYPEGDGSNEDETINSISSFNYDNLGWFTDASFSHTLENEKTKESDACGNEEIDNSVDLIPTVTVTLQEIGSIDLFASILGMNVQTIVGGAVAPSITKTFTAFDLFGTVISIYEYDAGGTITSVTGSIDGLLVAWGTDYNVVTDVDGNVGIDIIDSITVTTIDQDFVVVFAATVKDKKQLVYKAGTRSMPYHILRFRECPKVGEKRSRVHYAVKARVSSETVMEFVNESRTDFSGATITFTVAKDGNYAQSEINLP